MKLGSGTISAIVHIAVFAVIVFVVRSEPRLPTPIQAFMFSEEEKPPPPPPPVVEEKKALKDAPRKSVARAVTPTAVAAETARGQTSAKPLLDLGMVMDGDDEGGIPEGAVVLPSDMVGSGGTAVRSELPAGGGLVPTVAKKSGCSEEPLAPVPLSRADVEYPPDLEGVDGRVVAVIKVSADGRIKDIVLLEGVHPEVDRAVLKSLERWKFKAALRCGQPLEGEFKVALRFEATE